MDKQGRTPAPLSPVQRRGALLPRLLQGERVDVLAGRLGVSVTTIHKDVSYFVEVGALRRVSTRPAPLRVAEGPRAGAWLRVALETIRTDRGERSGASSPVGLPIRAHHWRWSRAFATGPAAEPPWSGTATASGVVSRWLTVEEGGGAFVVRAYLGHAKRLQVACPSVIVESGPDVLAAEERMSARARGVGEAFAKRYGILLTGAWRQSHPAEYAGPKPPGLRPFGRPGVDEAWADESEGEDRVEVETRRASLAAAWADLPSWEERVEARLARLERASVTAARVLERALAIQEAAWVPIIEKEQSLSG